MSGQVGATNRVAVVDGVRTPFVKAGTSFSGYSMQELGTHVLKALVERASLDPNSLDEFIFSAVLLDPSTPNWAREIMFSAGLPKSVYAHSVSNNCISGLVAITSVAERIALGLSSCGIAGGTESMSNPPLMFGKAASKNFMKLQSARSLGARLKCLAGFRFGHFWPQAPGVTEPSTGLTMGQHMEITAKELAIARDIQDQIALKSHQNAFSATEQGILTSEIAPLDGVSKDLIVRSDTSLEKLARLRPVFDKSEQGTITAGNASPLTDGASAVLLMSEQQAKAEGREVLAYISAYQYSAIDPNDGLLMAPAVAVPQMLKRVGVNLADIDVLEIHEAFAAQVAATVQLWEQGWKEPAIGSVDWSQVNRFGGSIAIGHPFAATGGRLVTTLANTLKRENLKRGLISVCAAGAMGGAMLLERD